MSPDRGSPDPARPKRRRRGGPKPAGPVASDQRPGEEPVQVNDAYDGGGPAPAEPARDEQHPTGG